LVSDVFLDLTRSAWEGRLTVFVGAGVSNAAPTNLPLAKELSRSILTKLSADVILSEDDEKTFRSQLDSIRPERLFSILSRVIGEKAYVPLQFFVQAVPNSNHVTLARLARNGRLAAIVTTNFDSAIERALEDASCSWRLFVTEGEFVKWDGRFSPLPVFKLHGSLNTKDANEGQVMASMEQVGNPLTASKADALERLLRTTDFLVMGYSGRDDFDIYPIFYNGRTGMKLLWLSHDDDESTYKAVDGLQIEHRNYADHIDRLIAKRGERGTRVYTHTGSRLAAFANLVDFSFARGAALSDLSHPGPAWDSNLEDWAREFRGTAVPYLVKGLVMGIEIGNAPAAIKNLERALETAKRIRNRRREAQSLVYLAIHQESLGESDKARQNLSRALTLAEEGKWPEIIVQASNELGLQFEKGFQIDEAFEMFQHALITSQQASLQQEEGLVCHNMAIVHWRHRRFDKAIEIGEMALRLRQECGDVVGKESTLLNLAYAYADSGRYVQAVQYLVESLETKSKLYVSPDFSEAVGLLTAIISNQAGWHFAGNALGKLAQCGLEQNVLGPLRRVVEYRLSEFGGLAPDTLDVSKFQWLRWAIEIIAGIDAPKTVPDHAPAFTRLEKYVADWTIEIAGQVASTVFPILECIEKARPQLTLELYLEWCASDKPVLRWVASTRLGHYDFQIESRLETLTTLAHDSNLAVQGATASSLERLAERTPAKALTCVRQLADDENFRVRETAASSLEATARKGHQEAIELLEHLMADKAPAVRETAKRIMHRISADTHLPQGF